MIYYTHFFKSWKDEEINKWFKSELNAYKINNSKFITKNIPELIINYKTIFGGCIYTNHQIIKFDDNNFNFESVEITNEFIDKVNNLINLL